MVLLTVEHPRVARVVHDGLRDLGARERCGARHATSVFLTYWAAIATLSSPLMADKL